MINRRSVLGGMGGLMALPSLLGASSLQSATPSPRRGRGLQFRWINNAGFELVLPSGAHVLIDPWLDSAAFNPLPLANIERADYILLSHTHGDHSQDVGAIQKRFPNVRIFVGQLSAEPLVKLQNLETSKIYKVSDLQEFQFGEVTIKAFAGRHTESNRGNYMKWDEHGEMTSASWGTLDLYQYLVTLPDGIKFMVWAGTPSIDNAYALAGLNPDIAAVHISPKQDFAVLGEILGRMNPRVVIPHHYDIWPDVLRRNPGETSQFPAAVQPVTSDDVVSKMMPYVERTLHDNGMPGSFFVPQPHGWYWYDQRTHRVSPIS